MRAYRIYTFFTLLFLIKINYITSQRTQQCPNEYGCKCQNYTVLCNHVNLRNIPKNLPDSRLLDFRYNKIETIPARSFLDLPNAKTLYLNYNNIKNLQEDSFLGLSDLVDLYLYNNLIETINPRSFNGLHRLNNLFLHNNKIRYLEPGTFLGIQSLQKINLYNNQLNGLPDGVFDRNSYITYLRLDNNNLDCDCDLLWLWQLFNTYKTSYRFGTNVLIASCYTPSNLANKKFTALKETDFECRKPVLTDSSDSLELKNTYMPKTVNFECIFNANPKPKITWLKNNVELKTNEKYEIINNQTLLIKNVDENDAGFYECIAKNRLGEDQTTIQLKILKENIQTDYDTMDDNNFGDYYDNSEDLNLPPTEDEKVKFTKMPIDQEVIENSNIVFNCQAPQPFRVYWIKDGDRIESDSRFYITSSGDLVINNVRVEDEGFYICAITDKAIERYAQAHLTVNVPPAIIKNPEDIDVVEGGSIELVCVATGKPSPKIMWKRNGNLIKKDENAQSQYELLQNGQILRVHDVKRNIDDGTYTCIAENSISSVSTEANIRILHSVAPYFTRVEQNITIYENHAVSLSCFAYGEPKPQVLWYKDGQRLATESRVFFDAYGYLSIMEVKAFDAGEYLCKATNIAGTVFHSFHLSVKDLHDEIIPNTIISDVINKAKGDVNKQIGETIKYLNDRRRKPKTSADLMALLRFPKDRTIQIAISEEVYERALELIFKYANNITYDSVSDQFKLEEVLTHRQLQNIADLSGCSRHKRKVNCTQRCLKYRTSDGTCNNLQNPHWGSANTQLRRLIPSAYENSFSTPRGWTPNLLHNGYKLPSPRVVSSRIITTKNITNDKSFTHMLMQWGQFFDHDLDHTVMAASLNRFSNGIACKDSCINEQPCFAIEIPQNDTFRSYHQGKCMEFIRSSAICGSGETGLMMNKIVQREQINQLTSYIDASNVYGSNDQDAFDLRERVLNNGQLKIHITEQHKKGLLPFNLDTPMDCQRDNTTQVGCFLAGDYRANEQLALLAMHNVWVRQHNRLAEKFRKINSHWSHEQIYQETRKIVAAQMQHITYKQWLPYIFGETGMKMLGKYQGYNPNVDASISNEFATAAFRFGHALIQPFSFRLNETLQPTPEGHLLLRDSFFAPHRFFYEGGPDPLMRGLYAMPAKLKMPREIMNSELTEKLFHITRTISQDLAALNIQRARDHGLPGYTEYRRFCNMTDPKTFDDLKNEISSKEVRDILRELYGDVRNIDLWPGGMLEDVVPGSKLGPLFMCIIVRQMKALRDGDRFWYENPGEFTKSQLTEIKKTNLAKIICETGDNIKTIQRDVFKIAKNSNRMVRCSDIEDVSLEPWRNCCKDNISGLCGETSLFFTSTEYGDKTKRDTDSLN